MKIKLQVCTLFLIIALPCCDSRVVEVKSPNQQNEENMSIENVYAISASNLDGETVGLDKYNGQVTLFVNVASKCGYTRQYSDLQKLHDKYSSQGFSVVGFPCNDFGKQEPGNASDIKSCASGYDATFDLMSKVEISDATNRSPVYEYLITEIGEQPTWNFGKYLIDADGKPVAFFGSSIKPTSDEITSRVESLLIK